MSDLFEAIPATRAGRMEHNGYHGSRPTSADFLARFHSFHAGSPVVHSGPSTSLSAETLGRSRFRFVHVDGSHTYEAVKHDIALTCDLATEGAVLVFDDFANVGHPGVAAALWPAVLEGRIKPFASSPSKLYVTTAEDYAARYRGAIEELASASGWRTSVSELPTGVVLSVRPVAVRRGFGARIRRKVRRIVARSRRLGWTHALSLLPCEMMTLAEWESRLGIPMGW